MQTQRMRAIQEQAARLAPGAIDKSERRLDDWEMLTEAVGEALNIKHLVPTHELRDAAESLDPKRYRSLGYYERWVAGLEQLLTREGVLNRDEIEQKVAELGQSWG